MKPGSKLALGAVIGLAFGVVVGIATDLPFAPEIGLLVGGLAGWAAGRPSSSY